MDEVKQARKLKNLVILCGLFQLKYSKQDYIWFTPNHAMLKTWPPSTQIYHACSLLCAHVKFYVSRRPCVYYILHEKVPHRDKARTGIRWRVHAQLCHLYQYRTNVPLVIWNSVGLGFEIQTSVSLATMAFASEDPKSLCQIQELNYQNLRKLSSMSMSGSDNSAEWVSNVAGSDSDTPTFDSHLSAVWCDRY